MVYVSLGNFFSQIERMYLSRRDGRRRIDGIIRDAAVIRFSFAPRLVDPYAMLADGFRSRVK